MTDRPRFTSRAPSRDAGRGPGSKVSLLPKTPLLISESRRDYDRIADALEQDVQPRDMIDRIDVAEVADLTWEVRRWRGSGVAIINSAFRSALAHFLHRLDQKPGDDEGWISGEINGLADGWFTQQATKKKVAQWLAKYGLDESAVWAEAIRRSAADLKFVEAMVASAEVRRHKVLRRIADRSKNFAQRLRQSSDRLITADPMALEHKASEPSPELA